MTYAIAVPNTLLTPFSSSLLTIPLSKSTNILVQRIIATGVAKTFKTKTPSTTRAHTPIIVPQIKARLLHAVMLSLRLAFFERDDFVALVCFVCSTFLVFSINPSLIYIVKAPDRILEL